MDGPKKQMDDLGLALDLFAKMLNGQYAGNLGNLDAYAEAVNQINSCQPKRQPPHPKKIIRSQVHSTVYLAHAIGRKIVFSLNRGWLIEPTDKEIERGVVSEGEYRAHVDGKCYCNPVYFGRYYLDSEAAQGLLLEFCSSRQLMWFVGKQDAGTYICMIQQKCPNKPDIWIKNTSPRLAMAICTAIMDYKENEFQ